MTKELIQLKEKMNKDFMYAFFDKWYLRTDGVEEAFVEFDLEPYREYVDTVPPIAFRLHFAREAKKNLIKVMAISIEDYKVKLKGAYDHQAMMELIERESVKHGTSDEKFKYKEKQEQNKDNWRHMGVNL